MDDKYMNWNAQDSLSLAHQEINRLRAEVEALRPDAERYRWLRKPSSSEANGIVALYDSLEMDSAVDFHIEKEKVMKEQAE